MIVGEALRRLIQGQTVDLTIDGQTITRAIQCHYGDNKELQKWILHRNNEEVTKYPLVWYVISPYTEDANGYKEVSTQLIIFQSTTIHWLNTMRTVKSYDAIIEPVWQKLKSILAQHPHVEVLGGRGKHYVIKDEPSYGVKNDGIRLGQSDFVSQQKQGEKSIAIDVVDGRIINLKIRIKTNCIL